MRWLQGVLIATMVFGFLPCAHADYAPIYCPIYDYDPVTETGLYGSHGYAGLAVNNSGTVVGQVEKFEGGDYKGNQAIRWDASGAHVVELGGLCQISSAAANINNSGTAIGYADAVDSGGRYLGYHAVTWSDSGTDPFVLEDIAQSWQGFFQTYGYQLNDNGVAIGVGANYVNGVYKGDLAVRWDASGVATALDVLGLSTAGAHCAGVYGINNAGTAIGWSIKYVDGVSLGHRPVRWGASGTAIAELDNLGVDANGRIGSGGGPDDINNAGIIVGDLTKFVDTVDQGYRAVRWDADSTAVTELEGLGVSDTGWSYSKATAINDAGVIAGHARKYVGGVYLADRAVCWGPSGTAATELAMLGTDANGSAGSYATDISEDGLIVGSCSKYINGLYIGRHAVFWDTTGQITDLNDLIDPSSGWVLTRVKMISDNGCWILGDGTYDPDGEGSQAAYERVFLMQIPEPASMLLLAFGGLALIRRRRQ